MAYAGDVFDFHSPSTRSSSSPSTGQEMRFAARCGSFFPSVSCTAWSQAPDLRGDQRHRVVESQPTEWLISIQSLLKNQRIRPPPADTALEHFECLVREMHRPR